MGVACAFLAGGTAVYRRVDNVCFAVAKILNAHRRGAAAIEVKGVLRIEPLYHKAGQFAARHSVAAGPASIYHHQNEMIMLCDTYGSTWMADSLMTFQIL